MKSFFCFVYSPVAGLLLFSGCGAQPEKGHQDISAPPAAHVRAQEVQLKPRTSFEEVVGTVRVKLRATLEARVSGRIDQMPVVLGQQVKAGDLIARLYAPEVQARLEQAQASLQQADKDWKRLSTLFEQQAVTRSEYDAADAKYRVAKGAVAEAQAMLEYVQVAAPFNGVVTRKLADLGDLAAPGKPLVELEDPSALQLEADVPEAIAAQIRQNATLAVRLESPPIETSGIVKEIARTVDPQSRTFRVKLDLPGAPSLVSGRFARLLVPLGQARSLLVPNSAVVQRGQLEIAFVVSKQQAILRLVKTGKHVGNDIEVLSGLDPGENLVIEGAEQLVDGQSVIVQ
ncbi:MAG TPA: efflux RND transporter periplasmic adaptor subunit [Candidatus Limnocylindrales bacterium]|nr:efflux RND transporter periplasmic adaptor subunit [Candidatus Limnocylindrales bacterium]